MVVGFHRQDSVGVVCSLTINQGGYKIIHVATIEKPCSVWKTGAVSNSSLTRCLWKVRNAMEPYM